jgi:hypothetical protein
MGPAASICDGRWRPSGQYHPGPGGGDVPMVITITKVEQIEATACHYIDGGVA